MLTVRKTLFALLVGALVVSGTAESLAARGGSPATKGTKQARTASKPQRGQRAARKPVNRVKRQAAATVAFKSDFKAERISDKAIVEAVRKGFADYLGETKGRMHQTRAEWNRIDPKSVKVKSVTIEKDKSSNLGWSLEKGERMFTAIVEVKQIENGKPRVTTAQVRSVIHLSPKLPWSYLSRVHGTPELKAEDTRYLGDSSTIGWID